MSDDRKSKKKLLKKAYRKKKNGVVRSTGGISWIKIILVVIIIIVVAVSIGILSWVNRPTPYVEIFEEDVIYAKFSGNNYTVNYLNTNFQITPYYLSISPVLTDFFPDHYFPEYNDPDPGSWTSTSPGSIEFYPNINQFETLDWDYKLNITDKNLLNWIHNPIIELTPNTLINNTETQVNVTVNFKANKDLDESIIRLGFKNNIVIGNNSAIIKPITSGYKNFVLGFYYERIVNQLALNNILELFFQINITLNSSTPFDILNFTTMNEYKFISITIDNRLISNYFSNFFEADVSFTGFDDDPQTIKRRSFGVNFEFTNVTLYPI